MSGIFDDLAGAVGAVAQSATPAQNPAAEPTTEDRIANLEQFVVTWGPLIEKLAPLLEKLEAL
jgi:hypothetical protein